MLPRLKAGTAYILPTYSIYLVYGHSRHARFVVEWRMIAQKNHRKGVDCFRLSTREVSVGKFHCGSKGVKCLVVWYALRVRLGKANLGRFILCLFFLGGGSGPYLTHTPILRQNRTRNTACYGRPHNKTKLTNNQNDYTLRRVRVREAQSIRTTLADSCYVCPNRVTPGLYD